MVEVWQHHDMSSWNTTLMVAITLLVASSEKPSHTHLAVKEICCSHDTESRAPSGYTSRLSSAKPLADIFSSPTLGDHSSILKLTAPCKCRTAAGSPRHFLSLPGKGRDFQKLTQKGRNLALRGFQFQRLQSVLCSLGTQGHATCQGWHSPKF